MKPKPTALFTANSLILLMGITTVGCSQTVISRPEPSPSIAASVQVSPSPVSESTPESIPEPKAIPARPLTTPEELPKEKRLNERNAKQKTIADRALLFSCMTDNGKEILLHQTDETIDYSFGYPDAKPELDLKVPRDRASTWQWKGVGRAMTYAVDIPNGEVSYSVFWSVDRLSQNRDVEAGVRVHGDRKTLATIYCTGKIVNNLQGVKLKPTEY